MKTSFYQAMMTTTACLLVGTGIAYAKPTQNNACTGCHTGAGSLMPDPNPIEILIGSSGLLSFEVGSLPDPTGINMIALQGLTQTDLDATIPPGGGGDTWNLDLGALADIKSNVGISTGPYALDLEIGLSAVLGTYNLTWYLAGDGPAGTSGTFTVNVILEPSADFDTDSDVDGSDFLAWQRGFGTIGGALKGEGDANDDGNVNADDLAIWQAQYGNPPPLSAVNSIPEPTTLVLVMLGMASAYCWRRNR
jgi:hypothetical protein